MRYILTAVPLLAALALAACSYSIDFAVVNTSERPIEISYKVGETDIDLSVVTGKPATLEASRLSSRRWRELSPAQYALDREDRVVTVSLSPGMALRVYEGGSGEGGEDFIIKALTIRGARGEVVLQGDQVYESFVAVPKPFFAFGPRTLFALTYDE